ncbi:MAG TPA: purine-nucleoside phosphorylase [Pirellulales bacterium]|jgi:purine-nucleoside phosphorylase|nr:purine-nucleoside phosphorylase [Pirellulales bacterium]
MSQFVTQIAEAAAEIQRRWDCRPAVGIILGTGLGNFAREICCEAVLAYEEIPHFVRSTAVGHKGQLVCGRIGDVPVVTMEGRFHFYEGYSLAQITLPVRVMKALGIELLIISNASGGLRPYYLPGDILVIEDHINLMGGNPLIGVNDDRLGPRFPDMSQPYDPALIGEVLRIARSENFAVHRGVYAGVSGPNYETRAEYRFLRRIGADVIGMSTVPEVIVAAQIGLRVLALSVITNVCLPDAVAKTDGDSVVASARSAEHKMRKLVLRVLEEQYALLRRQVADGHGATRADRRSAMLSGEPSAS